MSGRRMTNQATIKSTDDLIIIDSDDEDEVIFVNEDGGRTLSENQPLVSPGFLDNLPRSNLQEVRSLFDNIVKLPADPDHKPILIERSFTISPTINFDEEQIEFPNYHVQVLNKSTNDEPVKTNTHQGAGTIAPKPLITLAPISKLVDPRSFVPLDHVVNNLGVNVPQLPPKKVSRRRVSKESVKVKSVKSKPRVTHKDQMPSLKLPPTETELSEKIDVLKKFLPGGGNSSWSREHTLKRSVDFIMELRKSDCELDIAEEALIQSNIKLNMDFERMLNKAYDLCPGYHAETKKLPVKKTQCSPRKYKNEEDFKEEGLVIKEEPNISETPEVSTENSIDLASSSEECVILNNLLREVQESAKAHLMNFDPDIPFKDFLPPTLLNWDKPKNNSELLDEIKSLESAISECHAETEEIRKISKGRDLFKYEDPVTTFNKEFNLGVDEIKDELKGVKPEEITSLDETPNTSNKFDPVNIDKIDTKNLDPVQEPAKELSDVEVKIENKKPAKASLTKRRKKVPWNKGKKLGPRSKTETTVVEDSSNVEPKKLLDDVINSPSKDPLILEDTSPPSEQCEDNFKVFRRKVSKNLKERNFHEDKQPETSKAKKNASNKRQTKCRASMRRLCKKVCADLIKSDLDFEEKSNVKAEMPEDNINENKDNISLDEAKEVVKMPIIKLVREKTSNVVRIVLNRTEDIRSLENKETKNTVEESVKRNRSNRPKFTEGARTTRSFVKKCSEVMNEVDKEMEEFLIKKDKPTPVKSEDSDEDREENDYNEDTITNMKNEYCENLEEKLNETCEKMDEPDTNCLEVKEEIDVTGNFKNTFQIPVKPLNRVSPKKKKKYYSGKSKRKYRKSKAPASKEQLAKPTSLLTAATEKDAEKELGKCSDGPFEEPSIQFPEKSSHFAEDKKDDLSKDNSGSHQIISSCFSIDPSLFDNIDVDNCDEFKKKDESTAVIESSGSQSPLKGRPSTPVIQSGTDEPESTGNETGPSLADSPASPLALTVNKGEDLLKERTQPKEIFSAQLSDKICDAPLDFSKRNVSSHSKVEEDSPESPVSMPLNLSCKSENLITSANCEVIDFSVKTQKNIPTTEDVNLNELGETSDPAPFDLTKPSCLDTSKNLTHNYPSSLPIHDKPKTPFTSGKQFFSDPKIITPVIKTVASSVEPPSPSLSKLVNSSSLHTSNQSLSPAEPLLSPPIKDNIINEITDILVDLTDPSQSEPINFNLEKPSENDKSEVADSSQVSVNSSNSNTGYSNIPEGLQPKVDYQRHDVATPFNSSTNNSSLTKQFPPFPQAPQNAQEVPNYSDYTLKQQNDQRMSTFKSGSILPDLTLPYSSGVMPNIQPMQNFQTYVGGSPDINVGGCNQIMSYPASNLTISSVQPIYHNSLGACNVMARQGVLGGNQLNMSDMSMGLQQHNFINSPHCGDIAPLNDPRLQKQVNYGPCPDIDKQMMHFSHQRTPPHCRDPRLARKQSTDKPLTPNTETPFSGNTQINQLISEVIKHNNFENFLMSSRTNQMIMNQNLELDEEDLNLNRSDLDDFEDSDATETENKQKQKLFRKSINKLIVTDLKDSSSSLDGIQRESGKNGSESSDEDYQESSFTRRVLKSPPMVKKEKDENEYNDSSNCEKETSKSLKESKSIDSRDKDGKLSGISDSSYSSHISEEVDKSKSKKKLSVKQYLNRSRYKNKGKQAGDIKCKIIYSGSDEDYSPTNKLKLPRNKSKKRVIDSDEDSELSDRHFESESDSKVGDKSELPEEVSHHLKRVSDIKHRKLESKEKKIISYKRDPQIRQMKFLDELPDTDININKDLIPSGNKKHEDKTSSKIEKHLSSKIEYSPKSTSKIVRKTVTTEKIFTKKIGGDQNSTKKMKFSPDNEKKVFVQERITLKVNERSNLDQKGGIDFKCNALKEGEILKVVGGKLVRVRKKISDSDEELERERSKLHKCLHSLKIKKKSNKNTFVDDNPYSVLKEENNSPVLDGKQSDVVKGIGKPRLKRLPEESKAQASSDKVKSPSDFGRQSSLESTNSLRMIDRKRVPESCEPGPNHRNVSLSVNSSPNIVHNENNSNDQNLGIVKKPSMITDQCETVNKDSGIVKMNSFALSNCSNQVAMKQSLDNVAKTGIEVFTSKSISSIGNSSYLHQPNVEMRSGVCMDVTRTSHLKIAQSNSGDFPKRMGMEMMNRPDMELARESHLQVSRSSNQDCNWRFNSRNPRDANEIFTRRESFTKVERRQSSEGIFTSSEFSQESRRETSFTSERTGLDNRKEERSIATMFQRGEINMRDLPNDEERAWDVSKQRNDPWKDYNRPEESDTNSRWEGRMRFPPLSRDKPGEPCRNSWNRRPYRATEDRDFQPHDNRPHRNQRNKEEMFHIDDNDPQFQNHNEDWFRDRDDRFPSRDRDERIRNERTQYPSLERSLPYKKNQDWSRGSQKDFRFRRNLPRQHESPLPDRMSNDTRFREDRDYRHSPDGRLLYNDKISSQMNQRVEEMPYRSKAGPPHHHKAFSHMDLPGNKNSFRFGRPWSRRSNSSGNSSYHELNPSEGSD